MSRVLVTGGCGFIGRATVRVLLEHGYSVRVLDNLDPQVHAVDGHDCGNKRVQFIKGDIRFPKHLRKAMEDVEFIIHLAGAVGIGQSFWQARKYIDVNVRGTASIFEILTKDSRIRRDVQKITVASSKSIYGEGSYECRQHGKVNPGIRDIHRLEKGFWEVSCPFCGGDTVPVGITEDKPPQNLNPYSLSKYATERLAMDYSYALGIPSVALRYFNVYGPGQSLGNPYTGVIAIFMSRIKNGNAPFLFEDGKQMRDFIYVDDVAKVNVKSLVKGMGAVNVGTGKPISLLSIIDHLAKIMGKNIEPEISEQFRPGDNRHDFADASLLRESGLYEGFTPMSDGLKALVDWAGTRADPDRFLIQERERKKFLGKN